jgi:cytochrome c-type biogenesis protein CcmH/NrfF
MEMRCIKCGLENPKESEFCRKCGDALGAHLKCPQCGSQNPGDSLFCIVCGARLSGNQKLVRGNQRKCRNCGHFNELEALYCVTCGEEMIKVSNENFNRPSVGPTYKTIALVIGMIFLAGLAVKLAITLSKGGGVSGLNSAAAPISTPAAKVDEAQVVAVAKNFKCACGSCGELPLVTCNCDMPKGSVEEKRFIREKLAEGFTVEQVIEQLDKKYGHRV